MAYGLLAGILIDRAVGDPGGAYHPVAVFGRYAKWLETKLYAPTKRAGVVYLGACVLPPLAVTTLLARKYPEPALATAVAVALGGTTLEKIGLRMHDRLAASDLDGARELVPWLCSRDPALLDGPAVARATVESLAENTCDAVSAPIFWSMLGAPGVVAHRLVNTLDAMVGYKNERYNEFGWAAAKLDDLLAWAPARLTAATHVVLAGPRWREAVRAWKHDAPKHPSPNAGPVEATAAAALGVHLGGPTHYHYGTEMRPELGTGPAPSTTTIVEAVRLSRATQAVIAAVAVLGRRLLHRR